jgi:hypothetical protein
LKGKTDSAASTVQPQSEKSTTQRLGDSLSGNQNEDQVWVVLQANELSDILIIPMSALARAEG